MNGVTIGQYIPGHSWLHRLDPRNKIILTVLWIVLIFLVPNIYFMLGLLALYIILLLTTRLPIIKFIKGIRPVLFLLCFTFVLQVIYTKSGDLLYTFKFHLGLYHILIIVGLLIIYFLTAKYIPFKFSYILLLFIACFGIQLIYFKDFNFIDYNLDIFSGGLVQGSFIFLRIVLMIGVTSLLTFSTMSNDINNGLQSILSPLSYIKVPVGTISMIFSLTLRFIPLLYDETNKIMRAQASRGVDFQEGSLKSKVTQIISLLIPMFVLAFNKAEDLANAMETRGYIVGEKRSRYDELKFKLADLIAFVFTILLFAGVIVLNVLL